MNSKTVTLILVAATVVGCSAIIFEEPAESALYGTYALSPKSEKFLVTRQHYPNVPTSTITLAPDHSLSIVGFPDCACNGFGISSGKFFRATGTWKISKGFLGFGLDATINQSDGMEKGLYCGPWITLLRHHREYALRVTIGDPDSGDTLTYGRYISEPAR